MLAMNTGSDEWTLHSSGQYYISKSSPWCYSDALGYFYYDTWGRVVRQGEEPQANDPGAAGGHEAHGNMHGHANHHSSYSASRGRGAHYAGSHTPRKRQSYEDGEIPSRHSNDYIEPPANTDVEMKLVVRASKLLQPGSVVLVDKEGLVVGRDRGFERRLVLNEMDVSRYHCRIWVEREVEEMDDITPKETHDGEKSGGKDANAEVDATSGMPNSEEPYSKGPSRSDGGNGLENGAKKEPPSQDEVSIEKSDDTAGKADFDYTNVLERAKAIAARLKAHMEDMEAKKDEGSALQQPNPEASTGDKRARSESPKPQQRPKRTRRQYVDHFYITDCGSQHGTFINEARISESKMSSKPCRLKHSDALQIGTTTFTIHIHSNWPCDECRITSTNLINTDPRAAPSEVKSEPVPATTGQPKGKASLEKSRIEVLRQLKRDVLGLSADDEDKSSTSEKPKPKKRKKEKPKYVDRAALRRQMHGIDVMRDDVPGDGAGFDASETVNGYVNSDNQATDIPATPDLATPLPTSNIGSKLLSKMGWKAGEGLGASGSGRVDPIAVGMWQGRQGLGAEERQGEAANVSGRKETLKEATLRRARERFMDMM
ncbi:hypothetical protein HDU85_001886 [Gaertneriomyces sp. JEL0708]|nr:hypothetical protein HDU85_001886 [Gaertneriomyces sp. JEL0708]